MKKIICAALLAGAAAIMAAPAANAASIVFSFGNVSDAYSDGYWDSGHHWHAWRAGEWNAYRRGHPHAHNWRHDDTHHH